MLKTYFDFLASEPVAMCRSLFFLLLILPAHVAAQPTDVKSLQETVHNVIDGAEPSIACILVSRSDRYKEFFAAPSVKEPWKLGGFEPPRFDGNWIDPARQELIHQLDLANPTTVPESYGSGVVLDAEGLILTNFHVIQNATKVYVRFPGVNRGSYANIQAGDARSDLAVLKLINPPRGLKPIRIGEGEKVRKGDFVVSLANPFAAGFQDGSPSASWGIISNVRRRAPGVLSEQDRSRPLQQHRSLIQTDVRIAAGCSGGALLNLQGELIGITSSLSSVTGGESAGGYALPLEANMRRLIEVLKRGEEVEYGFLGVALNLNQPHEPNIARIDQVNPGTPASRAGLQPYDAILTIDGKEVRDFDDMLFHIGSALAGTEITIELLGRNGRRRTVKAKLARSPFPGSAIASRPTEFSHDVRVDHGSQCQADSPIPAGVSIREIRAGSEAEKKLQGVGDTSKLLIIAVNGMAIDTPGDFYREAKKAPGQLELKVLDLSFPERRPRSVTLP